jgi:hypothetical protein
MNSTYSKPGDTTVTLEKTANTTYQLDSTQVRKSGGPIPTFSTNFFARCICRSGQNFEVLPFFTGLDPHQDDSDKS